MRGRDVIGSLVGGLAVYVAVAACSGADMARLGASATTSTAGHGTGGGWAAGGAGVGGAQGAGGAVAAGGSGGAGPVDAGELLDAIADALMDPVSDAHADPVSGARLKARFRTGSDGSKEYLPGSWWDSQRGEVCSYSRAADGADRCLPEALAGVNSYPGFKDAACTVSVTIVSATGYDGGCPKKYVAMPTDQVACGATGSTLYEVSPPLGTWYFGPDCSPMSDPPGHPVTHFAGSIVPPGAFVTGTVDHD